MFQELINALRVAASDESIALPDSVRLVPAEIYELEPAAARGRIDIESTESLVAYLATYQTLGSVCFASRKKGEIAAVIDWHNAGTDVTVPVPQWGDHVAAMKLKHTEAWVAWTGISGRRLAQKEFAEFLEENLDVIAKPTAAEMLTIATTLEGKKSVNFKNGIRLQNGDNSLQWEENTEAKTAGDIKIPAEIVLNIPVYRGAEAETTVELRALFRYSIDGGKLSFTVKLLGVDQVADLAFTGIVASLREAFATAGIKAPVHLGSIEASPLAVLRNRDIK